MRRTVRAVFYALGFMLAVVAASAQQTTFAGTVKADTPKGGRYSYTVINNEPQTSSLRCGVFYIQLMATISSIQCPSGWSYTTDKKNYILFYVTSDADGIADIRPGQSLSGFGFTSSKKYVKNSYYLASADFSKNIQGPFATGVVAGPSP